MSEKNFKDIYTIGRIEEIKPLLTHLKNFIGKKECPGNEDLFRYLTSKFCFKYHSKSIIKIKRSLNLCFY